MNDLRDLQPILPGEPAVELANGEGGIWDEYVRRHPRGTIYHLVAWRQAIKGAYGHPAYYLMARTAGRVAGVLPLIHLKHFLFGNRLVSIPFGDQGGLLADDPQVAAALLCEAAALGRRLKAEAIELRDAGARPEWLPKSSWASANCGRGLKVGMRLALPDSSSELWHSFKPKLRSQIRRPQKAGLISRCGGSELLEDFYRIFAINMRDLGSPVHSRKFLGAVLRFYADQANLVVVYQGSKPVAGGLVIGQGRVLVNPWASALRQYSRLSPNMLLYWSMLELACERGFSIFDFGRSSPGSGTHRFKRQWGAIEVPLLWQTIPLGRRPAETIDPARLQRAADYWRLLPVPVATFLGPLVRKHISL